MKPNRPRYGPITLTAADVTFARTEGWRRYTNARSAGVTDCKAGDHSVYECDTEGAGGELAFARLFEIDPKSLLEARVTVSARNGEDADGDCTYLGRTIDVKTTKWPGGKLLCPVWKADHPHPDVYALMTGTLDGGYLCRGFIESWRMFTPFYLSDMGRGPVYVVRQSQLFAWEDLTWPPSSS